MGTQSSRTSNNSLYNKKDRSPTSELDESKYDDGLPMVGANATPTSSVSTVISLQLPHIATSSLPILSNEMVQINRMRQSRHTTRHSVHNGIIGIYLSMQSVKIAFDFWNANITNLNVEAQLEIGCSIFLGMIAADAGIKRIFFGNGTPNKLETVSLKFLDMMGYLMRSLLRNDINLYSSLKLLGTLHYKAHVSVQMYDEMLTSMHETFAYYFADDYTQDVKGAMDEIYGVISSIMTNRDALNHMNVGYLKSLDECLMSLDGKTALFSYLRQCGCNSIVLFYELLVKFKSESNEIARFLFARDIVRFNIDGIHGAAKKIDISCKTAQNTLEEMQKLDDLWFRNEAFIMDESFFDQVQSEVNQLILKGYWNAFKESILSTYY